MQPVLALERFYNRVLPGAPGSFAGTRVIRWFIRKGHARAPIVRGEESVRLEFVPGDHLDVLLRELELRGSWEPTITALLRRYVPEGGVFIDVGANIGYYSLLASSWVGDSGRVIAFEPLAQTFARLLRHIEMNGAKNVVPLRLACAASAGARRMLTFADSGWSHLATGGTEGEQVEATTIDDTIASLNPARVDVLKIDAEGADFEVLRGARRTLEHFRPTVLMETHHLHRFGATVEMVRDFLHSLDYEISPLTHDYSSDLLANPSGRPDSS
ncbi:MAG TPA: FkbM family methyltransferase [Gemmatimonadaceae bacterium]|nr:FkbM family methyltransferase [Gemmatimonadaceae bacterium]